MKLPAALIALRNPDYRLLWLGQLGVFAGSQMTLLARGYIAYEISGKAAVIGYVTLAQGLPMILLSLVGGVVSDRVQKRRLLFINQTGLVLISFATAILTSTGTIQIWHLVVLGVAQGAVFSFNGPTRQAYMIELIEPKELPNAVALFNSTPLSMRIIAPSIAGFLISVPFIGTAYIFYIITACYFVPHVMLFCIKTPSRVIERAPTAMLADFTEGVRYVAHHPVLKILVIAAILPTLVGNSYQNLLPVFAKDVLHVGAGGLGLMSTFAGIGSLIGSMLIASLANLPRRGLVQAVSGALFGVGLLFFGLAGSFHVALGALLVAGLAGAAFQTLNTSMLMMASEPEYYGRVSSVNQLSSSLSSMIVLPLGLLVDQIGAPIVMAVSGGFVVSFWLFVMLFLKSYRNVETWATADNKRNAEREDPPSAEHDSDAVGVGSARP